MTNAKRPLHSERVAAPHGESIGWDVRRNSSHPEPSEGAAPHRVRRGVFRRDAPPPGECAHEPHTVVSRRELLALAGSLLLASCVAPSEFPPRFPEDEFAALENRIGGRLGVALIGAAGTPLVLFRADERFAMCSTFKAALAAAVLEDSAATGRPLTEELHFSSQDLVPYAPVVEANVARGRMTVEELCRATVQLSDNAAANLLLSRVGGPKEFTSFCRRHGDQTTRLDRVEPDLNENTLGDPRDTTSPRAMASLLARLLLRPSDSVVNAPLRAWMEGTKTGKNRIRAGVPAGWTVGNKTGTGFATAAAFCDVAFLAPPDRAAAVLAVYCDRPSVPASEVEAAIAAVAHAVAPLLL